MKLCLKGAKKTKGRKGKEKEGKRGMLSGSELMGMKQRWELTRPTVPTPPCSLPSDALSSHPYAQSSSSEGQEEFGYKRYFFTGALPVFHSSVYKLGDKQDFSIRKLGCSSHILCAIVFLAFLFWLALNRLFVLLPRMRLAVGQSRSSPNITPRPVSWVAKLQIQKVPGCCL